MFIKQEEITRDINLMVEPSNGDSVIEKELIKKPVDEDTGDIFIKISRYIFYVLAFVLPLWFLPFTPFPFELNKAYLAYFLIPASFISWLVGSIKKSSLVLPKNIFLLSVGVLILVWGVSAIFSQSPHVSFIGLGNEIGTFASMLISGLALFLVSVLFQDTSYVKRWFSILFFSAAVVFLFQFLRVFFGLGKIFFGPATTNLVGGWNTFGIFSGLIAFLSLFFLEISDTRSRKIFFTIMFAGAMISLALVNFVTLWWIMAVFLIIFISYLFVAKKNQSFFDITLVTLLVVLFFILAQPLASSIVSYSGITFLEVRPSWSSTIDVIKQVITEHPILGSGPNTFTYDWMKWKPQSINNTIFWDTRFSSGVSHFVSFAASTGILGIISMLILIGTFIWTGFKAIARFGHSREHNLMVASLFASLYLWTTNIFYSPGFLIFIFTFIISGLFLALATKVGVVERVRVPLFELSLFGFISVMLMIFVFLFSISGVYFVLQKYAGIYSFGRGITIINRGGSIDEAENKILRAVRLDEQDRYYRTLADIGLLRLQNLISRQDIAPEEMSLNFQNILSNTIRNAQTSIDLNKIDPLNWLMLGRIYESVVPFQIGGAADLANKMYDEIGIRNSFSPAPYLYKARVAIQTSDFEKARDLLNQAIALKGDYTPARFLLVQIAVREGNINEAIKRAEEVRFLAPDDTGVLFQLGLLYYQNDNFETARGAFERAVNLNSNYANARYFLGLVYEQLDRRDDAIVQFEQVLSLNPGHSEVIKILENLKSGRSALSNISPPAPSPEERGDLPVE